MKVFGAAPATPPRFGGELILDREVLAAFGTLTVPGHVWRTLQRLGAWVEPVLVGEWVRLVRGYAVRRDRPLAPGEVEAALVWLDPIRDTALARTIALQLLGRGQGVRCIWSEDRLGAAKLDIDH